MKKLIFYLLLGSYKDNIDHKRYFLYSVKVLLDFVGSDRLSVQLVVWILIQLIALTYKLLEYPNL